MRETDLVLILNHIQPNRPGIYRNHTIHPGNTTGQGEMKYSACHKVTVAAQQRPRCKLTD